MLSLWLTRLGVRVRVIDKTAEPGTTSRALAVQARTLEFYDQIGLASSVVEAGIEGVAANFWAFGRRKTRAVFRELGTGLSPFPFALLFPQDEHERLLIDRLHDIGVEVERRTELVSFEDADGRIRARLRREGGSEEICEASYISGCDGAHSTVRDTLGIGFPGGLYDHLFYVADIEGAGPALNGELHVALERTDFVAIFPLKGHGRARLIGTVRTSAEQPRDTLTWDDVGKDAIERVDIQIDRVNWFSTYRVHHRVADHFRKGRAFLAGDAAHIHSPVGGQGMNTGIGDAVNLAWKVAGVVKGTFPPSLLDSYEPERIAFARRLVATTDRAFTAVTSPSWLARVVRLHVAPAVIPLLFRVPAVRRWMFLTVSQIGVNYQDSQLSHGQAGRVHGGDRLPWVKAGGAVHEDNFAALRSLKWQVHVYGSATAELRRECEARRLPLHVVPWRPEIAATGIARNALYLVRPDGYVGLADPSGSAATLNAYLDAHKFALG